MSSSLIFSSRVIAYVPMSLKDPDEVSDLKKVKEYCAKLPMKVEIFAEEIHPDKSRRPLFEKLYHLIRYGDVSLLIVPSMNNVVANTQQDRKHFLDFLEQHQVKLWVLNREIRPSGLSKLSALIGGAI